VYSRISTIIGAILFERHRRGERILVVTAASDDLKRPDRDRRQSEQRDGTAEAAKAPIGPDARLDVTPGGGGD
jgi:hypothetical protein